MTPIYQTPEKIRLKFEAIKEPDSFWKNKTVLDVGCNAGLLYPLLKPLVSEYVGIDTSHEYLEQAIGSFPNVRFVLGKFEKFKEEFDIIVSLSTFHIFADGDFEKVIEQCSKQCDVLILECPVIRTVDKPSTIYHTRPEWKIGLIVEKYFRKCTCYGVSPSPHDTESVRKVFKCEN